MRFDKWVDPMYFRHIYKGSNFLDFMLPSLDGKAVLESSTLIGKYLLLGSHFFFFFFFFFAFRKQILSFKC